MTHPMPVAPRASEGVEVRDGTLRVWWQPQIPCPNFWVPVASVDEATRVLAILADYDLFQFHANIKGDYCNMGGLEAFEGGEWLEWEDEVTGDDISAYRTALTPAPAVESGSDGRG